jgi:amino acid adenylation domain-containing protein
VKPLLQTAIARQAEERGDTEAVVMAGEHLTYEQLERRTNQLARTLLEFGCRHRDRVLILTPKSPNAIVSMIATLKAGAAYVPVDIASPATRIAHIVRAVEAAVVIADPKAAELLGELVAAGTLSRRVPVGVVEETPHALEQYAVFSLGDILDQSTAQLPPVGRPADPAHILFTSGSTGIPKGVVVTHANVLAFIDWATRYFGIGSRDRISGHPPLHFDLSTFDVFGALSNGAQLHLVPPGLLLPRHLAGFIRDKQLTQWFSVPAALAYISRAGALPDDGLPSLERVLWCGDVLAPSVLREWMRRVPQAVYTNLYGPTETTIASSFYTVRNAPGDDAPIPIGEAIPGEELLILDAERQRAPAGAIGDLWIAGVGVTPGYWRDPQQTGRVFIEDPRGASGRIYRTGDLAHQGPDGLFHFRGRADSQIKSRGYRIELGEIELALSDAEGLAEYAVVGVPSVDFDGTSICCAYVAEGENAADAVALRAHLARKLPQYMLPSRWVAFESLPKNVNGKIDRLAVRAAFADAAAEV